MPRTPVENLIPKADKLIIRTFPKVAQRLDSEVHNLDKAEMDAFLKMLPGAIERFQAVSAPTNDLHESVEVAIMQLVASFPKKSFESQPASAVDPAPLVDTRNTSLETGEIAEGDSESELPNGSDTDQSVVSSTLAHNELETPAGSSGESSDLQAGPRNPRVGRTPKLKGRARYKQRLQELAESAGDQGRLSESTGGS